MRGTWVQHWPEEGSTSHLMPIGDFMPHIPHEDCICGPTLVTDGNDPAWAHHPIR